MDRRTFVRRTAAGGVGLLAPSLAGAAPAGVPAAGRRDAPGPDPLPPLARLTKPLAIAMWDFSWILRHHRYGEFADWARVLDELAERGYDAIRLDVMPQYVAADSDGTVTEEYRSVRDGWAPVKWGNYYTMSFRPREALLEFLPLCRRYGMRVALSSWFTNHHTGPRGIFTEPGGALRAWTETLEFLQRHGLLDDNVVYVDLLNEFPRYHGYDWFKRELDARGDVRQFRLNNPEAFIPEGLDMTAGGGLNALQQRFARDFADDLLRQIAARFPGLPYHMSVTYTTPLASVDLARYGTLDYHLWFTAAADIPHWRTLASLDQSQDNRPAFRELLTFWEAHKPAMTRWMADAIARVAAAARARGIPCGNTEGWGPVGWMDHPDLSWDWVKEAGDIAVDLAKRHPEYRYLCTSNFTHPQFRGIWDDVAWHRRLTARIRA
ncbi:MAG TPA: cellulase-like family protein [Gemmatimonadaceae bacterium]|nr:cellulase-like family protein [Gemmatimonadaceae bacterium]